MPRALRLTVMGEGVEESRTFRNFPVRIGRDPEYECQLGLPFVSRRHARIDLEGDQLVLRDEGSTQGTYVRGMSAPIRDRVLLAEVGGEFQIGRLTLRAELIHDASPEPPPTLPGPGEDIEARRPDPTRTYAQAALDPAIVDARAALEQANAILVQQRERARALVESLIGTLEPAARASVLRELLDGFPELRHVPAVAALVSQFGILPADAETADATQRALTALASTYRRLPNALETPAESVAFLKRVDATLRSLIEGVVEILRSHAQAIGQVESPTAERLGTWLMDADFGDRNAEILSGTLLAIASDHAEVTKNALEGFPALLHELSPETFSSFGFGPLAGFVRWRAYRRRHGEFARLDEHALARLFGVSLVRACTVPKDDGEGEGKPAPPENEGDDCPRNGNEPAAPCGGAGLALQATG